MATFFIAHQNTADEWFSFVEFSICPKRFFFPFFFRSTIFFSNLWWIFDAHNFRYFLCSFDNNLEMRCLFCCVIVAFQLHFANPIRNSSYFPGSNVITSEYKLRCCNFTHSFLLYIHLYIYKLVVWTILCLFLTFHAFFSVATFSSNACSIYWYVHFHSVIYPIQKNRTTLLICHIC